MYTIWKVGDEEYKLRLTTLASVQAEKQLGMGMTQVLDHLMDTTVIITLLWASMQQLNHGINFKDVCEIHDRYMDNGGDLEQLTDVLLDLLAQIGIGQRRDTKNVRSQKAAGFATTG